jgi:hypothetical protein
MPAPATPTSFVVDAIASPWTNSASGGVSNYTAAKLTWSHTGYWIRLQILDNGTWVDLHQGAVAVGYNCSKLTATSAEIRALLAGVASFRVASGNADGMSAWTAQLDIPINAGEITLADLLAPVATLATNSAREVKITLTDAQAKESFFEIELRNVSNGSVRLYQLDTFSREFRRALQTDGVLSQTSYVARARAVSEKYTTRINGPWSNELVFTTPPPVIALFSLPATVTWWKNAPDGVYTITTNTTPDSIVTGTLPDGLTQAGAVISGVPSVPVGDYPVEITVENSSGVDVETLTFKVAEPSIALRFAKPGGPPLEAVAANAAQVGRGALGQLLEVKVSAAVVGPVSSGLTLSHTAAPEWLLVVGSSLKGTPTSSGEWDVIVVGTNSTAQTHTAIIRISVPAVAITSSDSLTVYEQQPISFPVVVSPSADTISASGLPAWLALDGATLTGTAPTIGDTHLTLTAALGTSTAVQPFTLHVLPVLVGPPPGADGVAEITGWVGDPLIEAVYYLGTCSIEHWYLSNQPPGVNVGALTCPGPYATNKAVAIVGAPTTYGIFEAVVTAQCCCDGQPKLYRFPVRFNISGGLFLHWFHSDPFRRELQVLMRTREVHSLYEVGDVKLTLKRGDKQRLHVIFRDGPFGDTRLGRSIFNEGFSDLRLVIRPDGDYDAEPYIEVGGAIVSETIDAKTIFYFDLEAKSEAIEAAFNSLNKSRGANPAAASLKATGELTWKRSDVPSSSLLFAVAISQDIER